MKFIYSLLFVFSFFAASPAFAGASHLISAATGTGASAASHIGSSLHNINQIIQCSGMTGSGSGAATIKLQGSNDGSNWIDLQTCSLTLGVSVTSSSAANTQNWYWERINVTAISGTGASVDAWLSW